MVKPKTKIRKKKERKVGAAGIAHIKATFNNTIVSITDANGGVVAWASAGGVGFKGTKKGTPFAASSAAANLAAFARAAFVGFLAAAFFFFGSGSGTGSGAL